MSITQRDLRIIEECRHTDEPVIVFRGQDKLAKFVLNFYHATATSDGADPDFREEILDKYEAFLEFERNHPDKMKMPDLRADEVNI